MLPDSRWVYDGRRNWRNQQTGNSRSCSATRKIRITSSTRFHWTMGNISSLNTQIESRFYPAYRFAILDFRMQETLPRRPAFYSFFMRWSVKHDPKIASGIIAQVCLHRIGIVCSSHRPPLVRRHWRQHNRPTDPPACCLEHEEHKRMPASSQ